MSDDIFTVANYPVEAKKPAGGAAHVWLMVPDKDGAQWAMTEFGCRDGIDVSDAQRDVLRVEGRVMAVHVEVLVDDPHPWAAIGDDEGAVVGWLAGVGMDGAVSADVLVSVVDVVKARCACAWVKLEISERSLGRVLAMG